MKLDIKSILILVLFGFGIVFFALWYFKGDDSKKKVKELEKKVNQIQTTRDSLTNINKTLKIAFTDAQVIIIERDNQIKKIESDLVKVKQDLNDAYAKVKAGQKALDETKKKIDELKKNPIKREDDVLLNSLKEKLNK